MFSVLPPLALVLTGHLLTTLLTPSQPLSPGPVGSPAPPPEAFPAPALMSRAHCCTAPRSQPRLSCSCPARLAFPEWWIRQCVNRRYRFSLFSQSRLFKISWMPRNLLWRTKPAQQHLAEAPLFQDSPGVCTVPADGRFPRWNHLAAVASLHTQTCCCLPALS